MLIWRLLCMTSPAQPSPAQPRLTASLKTLIHIIISSRPAITTFTTNHNTLSTLTTSGGFQRFSLLLQRPKYQIDPIPPKASDATGNGCGYSPGWWWPRSRPPSAWSRWSTSLQSGERWVKDMEGRRRYNLKLPAIQTFNICWWRWFSGTLNSAVKSMWGQQESVDQIENWEEKGPNLEMLQVTRLLDHCFI